MPIKRSTALFIARSVGVEPPSSVIGNAVSIAMALLSAIGTWMRPGHIPSAFIAVYGSAHSGLLEPSEVSASNRSIVPSYSTMPNTALACSL